jgi:hypothetical protein
LNRLPLPRHPHTPTLRHLFIFLFSLPVSAFRPLFNSARRIPRSALLLLASFQFLVSSSPSLADIHYVNIASTTPTPPYASWDTAARELPAALAEAATGDEVWVARGTYVPGTSRTDSFRPPAGVALYGGFTGDESLRDQRNPWANLSILSGDLNGDDGPNLENNTENAYHVVTAAGQTVLDGFVVSGGNADAGEGPDSQGGGLYAIAEGIRICLRNCRIERSFARRGGGVILGGGGGTVDSCIFAHNNSDAYGDALALEAQGDYGVTNCLFWRNGTALWGAPVHIETSQTTLRSCTFAGNASTGAAYAASVVIFGGGRVTLSDCVLWDEATPVIANGWITVVRNCVLRGGPGAVTGAFDDAGGNRGDDPQFCDDRDGDGPDDVWATADDGLGLRPHSPCIDAGSPDGAPAVDLLGTPRPRGAAPDIGAYEYPFRPAPPVVAAVTVTHSRSPTWTWRPGGAGCGVFRHQLDAEAEGLWTETTNLWWTADPPFGSNETHALHVQERDAFTNWSFSGSATVRITPPRTIYVQQNAQGANDGSSWGNAYTNLEAAVAAALDGDSVLLAYDEGYRISRQLTLTNAVVLRGQWAPGTRIDAQGTGRCLYMDHPAAAAEHLTFTGGNVTNWEGGGGVLCGQGRLTGCIVVGNTATKGGGVLCQGGAIIEDCAILSNSAVSANASGGGLVLGGGTVRRCRIEGNSAAWSGGGLSIISGEVADTVIRSNTAVRGAGVRCFANGRLTNCSVEGNLATELGGGAYVWHMSDLNGPILLRCTIRGNRATDGGGIALDGLPSEGEIVESCILRGNAADHDGGGVHNFYGSVRNSLIVSNSCGGRGGGIFWRWAEGGWIDNCTVVGNTAEVAGGGLEVAGGSNAVRNSLFYDNQAPLGANWEGGVYRNCGAIPAPPGEANLDADPVFRNRAGGDFRLSPSSPCIEAGQNVAWMMSSADLAGNPRVFAAAVDLGAYEYVTRSMPRLLLQGAWDPSANGLRTALAEAGALPAASPYAEDADLPGLTGTGMADWVLLSLLATNGLTPVAFRAALLRADGVVLDANGQPGLNLEAPLGWYYLAAKHRNHAAVVSAAPVGYTNDLVAYDFTTGPDQYLGGTNACVELEPGVWGLIAGDADGDGRITPTDRAIVTQQMGKTGYLSGDLNLDGKVDGADAP